MYTVNDVTGNDSERYFYGKTHCVMLFSRIIAYIVKTTKYVQVILTEIEGLLIKPIDCHHYTLSTHFVLQINILGTESEL